MFRRTALATCLSMLLAPAVAAARPTIQSIVDAGIHPQLNRHDFTGYGAAVRRAYESNRFQPLWLVEGRPTPQALELLAALRNAKGAGLLPADYDAGWLEAERARLEATPDNSAVFDTGLTVSLMRYLSDSYRGRVDPRAAGFEVDFAPKRLELGRIVPELARAEHPAGRLTVYEPPFEVYRGLKGSLERMRTLAHGNDLPIIPAMPTMKPGERDPGIPAVREYLLLIGYLDVEAPVPEDMEYYDDTLALSVARFQGRHGLEPDSILGRQTQRQMRVPLPYRVKQIEWAMERLRWLPYEFTEKLVLVNLPEFRLRGFDYAHDTAPLVTMNVVVGSAAGKTETPILDAEMRYVIFHPYWNVPATISEKELVPTILKNPKYLAKHDYEIVIGTGNEAVVVEPNAENLALLAAGRARLRQGPGDDNALGLVKFIFPNPKQVYLHDTPSKSLFSRSRRDFSHGCIRVQDPVGLARFVLGEKWSEQRVVAAMEGEENRRVNLPAPVRVILYYTTAVVGEDGEVYFFDDIYGHDAKLAQLIAKGYRSSP